MTTYSAAPTIVGYMGIIIEDVLGGTHITHRSIVTTPELADRVEHFKSAIERDELQGEFVEALLAREPDKAMPLALAMLDLLPGYPGCHGFVLFAETFQGHYIASTAHWLPDGYDAGSAEPAIVEDMLALEAEVERRGPPQPPLVFGIGQHGIVQL